MVFATAIREDANAADPIKVGPEIVLTPGGIEERPRVASDPAGNFMVVWEEDRTIQARRWFATGNEFLPTFQVSQPNYRVGTDGSSSTGNVGVAADAAGNFMVTYTAGDETYTAASCILDEKCLFTRRSDANGLTGAAFVTQDPTTTYVFDYRTFDQVSNPEVASLANGDFVVVWEGYDLYAYPDGSPGFGTDESTFARKTVASGQNKGNYFRVNDEAAYYQGQYGDFTVSGADDGGFVVIFRDESDYYAEGGNLRAQLYNDKGKEVGGEFGISSEDYNGNQVELAHAGDGTFMVVWNGDGLTARLFDPDGTPITSDFTLGTGWAPAIAAGDDSFVAVWRSGSDIVGQRFDLSGAEISSEFEVGVGSSTPDVASAANGDFVVTWSNRAQRFQVETPVEQEIGVFGKVLVLSNKVPDDPEKNKVKWKATGPEIVSPPRGTSSDPRCNGDPVGTVKATVRFFSPTSGHDSGVIDLPCENWFALGGLKPGQVSKRSYRYRDSQLDEGPCKSVLVKGEKSISVKCQGKGETTDFPYDIEVGTVEGTVHAVLDMGLYKFCSSFPPDGNADGSDGKKFKGKNAVIVGCPL